MASRKFLVTSAGACVLALGGGAHAESGSVPASGSPTGYDDVGGTSAMCRS